MNEVIGYEDKYDRIFLDIRKYLINCKWVDISSVPLKINIPTILEPFQTIVLDFVNVVYEVHEFKEKRVIVSIDKGEKIFTYQVIRIP